MWFLEQLKASPCMCSPELTLMSKPIPGCVSWASVATTCVRTTVHCLGFWSVVYSTFAAQRKYSCPPWSIVYCCAPLTIMFHKERETWQVCVPRSDWGWPGQKKLVRQLPVLLPSFILSQCITQPTHILLFDRMCSCPAWLISVWNIMKHCLMQLCSWFMNVGCILYASVVVYTARPAHIWWIHT